MLWREKDKGLGGLVGKMELDSGGKFCSGQRVVGLEGSSFDFGCFRVLGY